MSHFLESFKLLYCPLATEGQQDTFGPHSVWPWAPKSPDFTSKVSQEAPSSVHCPPCSGSFTPPLNRTDNNAAKQGTKLITSTTTRKALSCPPPQWLAWDLSGTAVGGKERKCWNSWDQKQAASARCTLPCCWLVCWHVPPSAASTSLIPARYLRGSFLGTKGDRTELLCFGQEKRQEEWLQDLPLWGLGTPVWLTAPNSPTGNVRTWVVRGPTTDCVRLRKLLSPHKPNEKGRVQSPGVIQTWHSAQAVCKEPRCCLQDDDS